MPLCYNAHKVYKATADVKEATFEKYAAVQDDVEYPWAKWRNIILAKKQPRKAFVQCNPILSLQVIFPTDLEFL